MEAQYEETPGLRPVYTILVSERNKKMKERLGDLLKKGGKYFVVVGAGHFAGAGSIIDLFEKEGFSITRQ
jgi:uncharacterized protein YbaP (TraB family)